MSDLTGGRQRTTTRAYAYYVMAILTLTNALSIADRTVMSLLLEPIKMDLGASDTSMSLLTGAAFVLFYTLFGIPIARWADRGNRRSILSLGVALWSVATGLCGVAGNFATMALARAGVGVGESTSTPTSMSLIADYFERKTRPKMIAIFNMAQPFSAVLITPFIGIVADQYGWRSAFYFLAIPGILIALLVQFTVREPIRGATDEKPINVGLDTTTINDALKAMWRSKPFMLILLGTAITGLGNGTLGAWGPALMMRGFGLSMTEVGAINAPIGAIGGILGGIGGGFLTGWIASKRKSERWNVLLPAIAGIVTVPAAFLYAWAPSWQWMVFGGFWGALTIAFRVAPYLALSMELVPANFRGMVAAATLIATNVVGQAGGPLVVGMISDALAPTMGPVLALRWAMTFAPFTLALGVIPFFIALKYFDNQGVKTADRLT
ncbi:spinster family MFS transporter [Phenylobacterium immobile]|uniref:spinster family MFS transporter n=1 Tax=Phenylobacterium immobile TaxID=21 RepID=UPI000B10C846|nr:MFS transporter [Phenylobacterium immobile]